MDSRTITQLISLVVAIYSLVTLWRWGARIEARRLWAIPVGFWLFHTIVYYIYVIISEIWGVLPEGFFGNWGTFLRLHGYITVAMIVFVLNKLNGRLDGHHDDSRISK